MDVFERTLTIKRVPTVLSNYQEDDSGGCSDGLGCGRNCLGKCCLLGSKFPLYVFKEDDGDVSEDTRVHSADDGHAVLLLNDVLLGQWEERMKRGLFRYDVTLCETRIIPGRYGFIAQLNEGRHLKKRPTEFRVDQVLQQFDGNKFNFTKVGREEALTRFEPSSGQKSCYFPCAPVTSELGSPNIIAINVSPIEYGHVLLIPRIFDCLPQRIDHESFLLAVYMVKEAADPFFRVGYNSLGAFATINHLHFQAYYLQVPFPVEKALGRRISKAKSVPDNGVIISELLDYPVKGFVFEGGNTTRDLSDTVANMCICLQENNIPFNALIAGCGKRIFLFPQCYAKKQALGEVSQELLHTQVNPAVWEISGHIVLKRREDYEKASDEYTWRLLAEVSLSQEMFQRVKAFLLEASELQGTYMNGNGMIQVEDTGFHGLCSLSQHLLRDPFMLHWQ